jgi:hypothetical protein
MPTSIVGKRRREVRGEPDADVCMQEGKKVYNNLLLHYKEVEVSIGAKNYSY